MVAAELAISTFHPVTVLSTELKCDDKNKIKERYIRGGGEWGLFSGEYYWREFCLSKWVGLDN